MQEKKSNRGGSREGAGRKPFNAEAMHSVITARLTANEKHLYSHLGGVNWLRSAIEKAAIKTSPLIPVRVNSHVSIPITESSVQAGFPSPAEDYLEGAIDFNELLIDNVASTFVLKAAGESMIDAGIQPGDYLVVNRSREPKNQDIVIMQINNEFTVKRYIKEKGQIYLKAENSSGLYSDIYPNENDTWITFGVVSFVIKAV